MAVAVLLFAFCRVGAESIPTVSIDDGGSLEVPGIKQTGNQAVNARKGEISVLVKAVGDATIKVTRPDGADSGTLYFTAVATNGTLTLDLTEWEGCDFRIDGGFITHPGGELAVKGRDSLVVGLASVDVRAGFGDRGTAALRNTSSPVAFGKVAFLRADGTAYDDPAGITLSGAFWDAGISPETTCPWSVEDGSVVAVDRRHGFVDRYASGGKIDVDRFDLWVLNPVALDGVASLRVSPGRNLRIVPRTVKSYDLRHFGWDGLISGSDFTNSVELLGGDATLTLSQHYAMTFSGDVTGSGTLRVALEHQNQSASSTVLTGSLDYSGPLKMDLASAATNYTLRVDKAADFSDNPVTLSPGSVLHLNYRSGETAMQAFSGTSGNLQLPPGTIRIPSRFRKLEIAEVGGTVGFHGYSSFSNTVEIATLQPGALVCDNALVSVVPGSASDRCIRVFNPCGNRLYRLSDGTDVVDMRKFALSSEGEYRIEAANGFVYSNPPENMRIDCSGETSATVLAGDGAPTLAVKDGGVLEIGRAPYEEWKNRVMLWLDPSKTDSWQYWTYNGNEGYDASGTCKAVGPWGDWRDGKGEYYLVTDKHYIDAGNKICPFVVPDGLNGLPYMSFKYDGSRRRMLFYPVGVTNSEASKHNEVSISPKFVVMVFGSQNGGGSALLGNSDLYYQRGGAAAYNMGADNPVFANGEISTWVDGKSVNPSECNLNGAWQIVSVDTSKAGVSGIGLLSDKNNSSGMGNQNYAEIMFFDEVLSDSDRIAAERYLAAKWGLDGNYGNPEEPVTARVFGNGTVELASDVQLSGAFSGSVALNGHSLSFAEAALPPVASDVAAIAGRVAWFDPEDETRLVGKADGSGSVDRMFDRDVDMSSTAGGMCLDAVSRDPMAVVGPRGCGPSRRWLEYSPAFFGDKTNGRSMRMQRYGETSAYAVDPVTARTVFLVQDSSKGGGTPFMSTVGDTGELLSPRLTEYAAMPPDFALPIWRSKSATTFAKGATFLDGRKVDGSRQGFNGRAELLTAVGGVDFPFGATGYCLYMDGIPVEARTDAGEIHGEIMVYNKELSDDERRMVEAYLMYKWLGTVNAGYGVYTNLAISGSGSVAFASLAQVPKFSPGFSGGVKVDSGHLAFGFADGGNLSGALDFGGATVSFPSVCAVDVACGSMLPPGTYRLVSSAGISPAVEWILNLAVASGGTRNRSCCLVAKDGNLDLVVDPAGTVIVVR